MQTFANPAVQSLANTVCSLITKCTINTHLNVVMSENKHVSLPLALLANEILKELNFPGKTSFKDTDIQETVLNFCNETSNA